MNLDPALQEQLRSMLSKSRRSLKAAQNHLAEADFDFAASRAYYAAFYAMYEFDVSVKGPDAEQDVVVATEMLDAIERLLR